MVKKKKLNKTTSKTTVQELQEIRDGGQIALTGFTYQFLYSCYLILSESDENTTFYLEGIEDIDHYKCEVNSKTSTHIQLKYSTLKQDASFLKDVLKNFLEVYLINKTSNFKLVYDFTVAKGNLSKLFSNNLDQSSNNYWREKVQEIKNENPLWNWEEYSFDDFIKKITFEKQDKNVLSNKIEKKLIKKYDISTGNIALFANGIKMCCLKKMERRESITQRELDAIIQSIKDDISKGVQNPAHRWIKKLDFDISVSNNDFSYFEGKKATPLDIAMKLPVRRLSTEKEIEDSIQNNRVTVIKASSGQGKTTMALQTAYNMRSEYTVYQLLWCNDSKELDNILQYFKSRIKLGEKPLIVIDNLDSQLSEWNSLAQLLQEEVSYHYKLLLTTREDDWFNYSGNLSNVRSLQVIKLFLNEEEAKNIYDTLQKARKLHHSITDWRSSWETVANKKLLIEFVYLLTHGEMISERIAHQISQINSTDTGRIKCEILRKVCFADICGIRISVNKLVNSLLESTNKDYGELLKSIENEFLIRIDITEKYIEGLHPVRSQHIVDKLHEFTEVSDTALQVIKITDITYLPKLFSNLPQLIDSKETFYSRIVDTLWNGDNLAPYILAMRGLFSGSVMQYYVQNKMVFDDADDHGGLFLMATELNPFTRFEEFDYSLQTLDELKKISPDNTNIQYLCSLRDSAPKIVLSKTDIYYFSEALYSKLKNKELTELTNDIPSYSSIAYWLLNIDRKFNLSNNISLEAIWTNKNEYTIDVISSVMYTCFYGNKEIYTSFVEQNLSSIMNYLKIATKSLNLYLSDNGNNIHVEYVLLPSDIRKGNDESVSRLKLICKTLPIFETYCADALKPTLDFLSGYNIPDDAHKAMPIRNIILMFHEEFASLWSKTITSNYECDSVFEWLNHWLSMRKNIITLFEKCIEAIHKLLGSKRLGQLATDIDNLRAKVNKELIRVRLYPNEDRPFEDKAIIPEGFNSIKADYFSGIQNFANQLVGFLQRDKKQARLALSNLRASLSTLKKMQMYFEGMANEQSILQSEHSELCLVEEQVLKNLLITCKYFQEHQPSKYFSKYQINVWYGKSHEKLLNSSKDALSSLAEEFLITYPDKYYYEGILKFYPIIIDNFDITNLETQLRFLYFCNPIAALNYDYLTVASKNKEGQINPSGLRIPTQFLKDLKTAIDTDDVSLMEKLSPPFPEEISQRFLDCFEPRYAILMPTNVNYEGRNRILELLWAFSKSKKELIDESDYEYLTSIEKNIKKEVLNLLKDTKKQIPYDDFCELTELCENTFEGSSFGDIELNVIYNKLIS